MLYKGGQGDIYEGYIRCIRLYKEGHGYIYEGYIRLYKEVKVIYMRGI